MCLPSQSRKFLDRKLFLLAPLLAVLCVQAAQAQMVVDMAKITCRQYLFDRTISPEAPRIATWLSGYFNGARNNTTIDIGTMRSNKDKVEDYCRMNQDVTIMDAARKALGLDKP
jgi:opacity protein-like surface antigen